MHKPQSPLDGLQLHVHVRTLKKMQEKQAGHLHSVLAWNRRLQRKHRGDEDQGGPGALAKTLQRYSHYSRAYCCLSGDQ